MTIRWLAVMVVFVSARGVMAAEIDLTPVLDRLDTLIFLATAAAFALGGLLGFASWAIVLRAMRESDF